MAPRHRDARTAGPLSLDGNGASDGKRLDGFAEALQPKRAERLSLDEILDRGEHPPADHDLPRFRGVAQP